MTLEELKNRCNEATPGPWQMFVPYSGKQERASLIGPIQFIDNQFSLDDAAFICLARTYMPILIEIAETAEHHIQDNLLYSKLKDLLDKLRQ